MGAFQGVSEFFDRPLYEVAEQFGYDEDNLLILSGNEQRLRQLYPETYRNLIGCRHNADRRTPMEYGQDLVASWMIEDYFLAVLSSDHYDLALNGADRNRKILPRARISASSDYMITAPGIRIRMELMNDYTGFWRKTHRLHLRDAKYWQLRQSGSLFIAISTPTREFAIYDFRQEIPAAYIPSHPAYGGKSAYELQIPSTALQKIAGDRMERAILERIGFGRV